MEYSNFFKDFPSRCSKILNRLDQEETVKEYDVSLLLMASAAFVMSFEKVRYKKNCKSSELLEVHQHLNRFNNRHIGDFSESLGEVRFDSWYKCEYPEVCNGLPQHFHDVDQAQHFHDVDQAQHFHDVDQAVVEYIKEQIDKTNPGGSFGTSTTSEILALVRNAIAHGNILTINKLLHEEFVIERLVFISGDRRMQVRKYLCVSVLDFKKFLKSWFKYLEEFESKFRENSPGSWGLENDDSESILAG